MTLTYLLINICLYSIFPLFFATLNQRLRPIAFYSYLSVLLFIGSFASAIYSFPITETTNISGGNLAFGAFMMSVIILIIVEHDTNTFRNLIRLVVIVDLFVFMIFNFLTLILGSQDVLTPFDMPSSIFNMSLWLLIIGGVLILCEVLLLFLIFSRIRKHVTNLAVLAIIYTSAYILIFCLDGLLFPLLAFSFNPDLVSIMIGNIYGKLLTALFFSLPMLLFYFIFRKKFNQFLQTPLTMKELLVAPRKKLIETLSLYEIRDQQFQNENQILQQIAEHDKLTGLANRRRFDKSLDSEWAKCQQTQKPLTLILGDIDFFKQYNDTYGHQQGDICLKNIAEIWGNIFKTPSALAARIGGEEFAIILPNISVEQVLPKLKQFLILLEEKPIPHSTSAVASHITMSMGVVECIPNKHFQSNELFLSADKCLYKAKNTGRNKMVTEIIK